MARTLHIAVSVFLVRKLVKEAEPWNKRDAAVFGTLREDAIFVAMTTIGNEGCSGGSKRTVWL